MVAAAPNLLLLLLVAVLDVVQVLVLVGIQGAAAACEPFKILIVPKRALGSGTGCISHLRASGTASAGRQGTKWPPPRSVIFFISFFS